MNRFTTLSYHALAVPVKPASAAHRLSPRPVVPYNGRMGAEARHEAMLYEKLDGRKVQCHLCGHECVILAGKYGLCRVRQNVNGELLSLNYGRLVSANPDPVEKKPLYHFLPGTRSFSIASAGCNFQCEFCQNWQISQAPREGRADWGDVDWGQLVEPAQIVAAARRAGCASVSYTYTEPTVFFELAHETATLAAEAGLKNCFVSNGFMTPLAVRKIAPVLDAINVDLKAFRDDTYRTIMKARLEPVLACLRALVAEGVWVEVTTLVVPGMNDSPEELTEIARFIAGELGRDVPWHLSRYHDNYKMSGRGATPLETLATAARLGAEAGLRYVYQGNVPDERGSNTICPACGAAVIERGFFQVTADRLRDGACGACGERIAGVWG